MAKPLIIALIHSHAETSTETCVYYSSGSHFTPVIKDDTSQDILTSSSSPVWVGLFGSYSPFFFCSSTSSGTSDEVSRVEPNSFLDDACATVSCVWSLISLVWNTFSGRNKDLLTTNTQLSTHGTMFLPCEFGVVILNQKPSTLCQCCVMLAGSVTKLLAAAS